MQRIEALIEKLRTQFNSKADLSQLLVTVQMIQQEINGEMKEMAVLGSSNVAVFVPNFSSVNKGVIIRDKNGSEKEYFKLEGAYDEDADEEELRLLELQHQAGLYNNAPEKKDNPSSSTTPVNGKINDFDPLLEVPTLFQQVRNGSTTRQKNQAGKPEATDGLATSPAISDLTTDISDQDKERFVSRLFRGDEIMYNRSIKTINNFDSLEEAEYWVKRELKTKLGWINNSDVEYFDRLIYKRFSRI
ncbi:hypothetical protein [Niabella beijingensis]|uniref:hypothetical protein n=1 Tax=Niabella beijingensis TaxID=2872700 RepID=UPI001CBDC7D6|nr:hypothetical protein [Niabella beijingensis]MBZ4192333.1 hypothetical protein [Niabella beijingensis]